MADKKAPKKKSYTKEEIQMMLMSQAISEGNKATASKKKENSKKRK